MCISFGITFFSHRIVPFIVVMDYERKMRDISHTAKKLLKPNVYMYTLESGINIRVRLLIFEVFSRGYVLIKGGYVYWFLIFKNFLRIFNFLFLWLCIKESNYLLFKRGLRLFKGLCLLFLPNFPGAMFIQGGTFIPDSRVLAFQ